MATDTTPAAEQRQHEIFKQMSGERRLLLAMAFSDRIRDIAMEGLRRRHPTASESGLKAIFIKEMYGVSLPDLPEGNRPFEHDLSAVRGEMNARKLVVFEHEPKTT